MEEAAVQPHARAQSFVELRQAAGAAFIESNRLTKVNEGCMIT